MDNRNKYNKIKKMLKSAGSKISLNELRKLIIVEIGSSEDTIRDTIRLMIDTGLIKEFQEFDNQEIAFDVKEIWW